LTVTVGAGQMAAHMLFNWTASSDIDVVNVWNVNTAFGASIYTSTYVGSPDDPDGSATATTVYSFSSSDPDSNGIKGLGMIDGPFGGFNANFNLTFPVGVVTGVTVPMVTLASGGGGGGGGCAISGRSGFDPVLPGSLLLALSWLGWRRLKKQ
jgi:hypothetical protein